MFKKYKIFVILFVASLLLDVIFLINKDLNIINIANAFFITSVIYLSFGGYSFIASKGMFSAFSYSMKKLNHILFHGKSKYEGPGSLYEHHMYILEKRKENRMLFSFLSIGLLQLIVSIIYTYII